MKKVLLYIFMTLFFIGCNQKTERFVKQKEALTTNIQVDTTMFDVCFNDNPNIVLRKLNHSSHKDYNYQFEYRFPDERLKDIKWKWNNLFAFHKDSLYCFSLKTEKASYKVKDVLKVLEEIYSLKYGGSFEENKELFWYKGNLEINIHYMEEYSTLFIEYTNLKNNIHGGQELKIDENYNSYTLDYWNRTYKHQEDESLRKVIKDI